MGRYLIIKLKQFVSYDNQVMKDMKHVQCSPNIYLPVKDDVIYQKDFNLIAIIGNTGKLKQKLHHLYKILIQ